MATTKTAAADAMPSKPPALTMYELLGSSESTNNQTTKPKPKDNGFMSQREFFRRENDRITLLELLQPAMPIINAFANDHYDASTTRGLRQALNQIDVEISTFKKQLLHWLKDDAPLQQQLESCTDIQSCRVWLVFSLLLKRCQQWEDPATAAQILMEIESKRGRFLWDFYHHIVMTHLRYPRDAQYIDEQCAEVRMKCSASAGAAGARGRGGDCEKYKRHRMRDMQNSHSNPLRPSAPAVPPPPPASKLPRMRSRNGSRNRSVSNDGDDDVALQYYIEFIDLIHCTIIHRFRESDNNGVLMRPSSEFEDIDDDADDDDQIPSDLPDLPSLSVIAESEVKHAPRAAAAARSKKSPKYNKFFTRQIASPDTICYDFGYRFYYWNAYQFNEYYEDHGPNAGGRKKAFWYIVRKYASMKEELLYNKICKLASVQQFDAYLKKAEELAQSSRGLKIRSCGVELSEHCEVAVNSPIQAHNFLSLLLYTNDTKLSAMFSGTFRKKYPDEPLEEMKQRNAEFWHWSKCLIETVELYGTMIQCSNIKPYYHGVSYMTFPSFLANFCGPTSTTTTKDVARRFCGDSGLILELVPEHDFSILRFFDVHWFSAYEEEDERLFIWGNRPLKFQSILKLSLTAPAQNYAIFIAALTLFDYILSGKPLPSKDQKRLKTECRKIHAEKIVNGFLEHFQPGDANKNSFNEYANLTFQTFAFHRKQIFLHFTTIKNDYPKILPYIASTSNTNLILFNKFAKAFPNCETIIVTNDASDEKNTVITKAYLDELRRILEDLNQNNHLVSLRTIVLHDVRYKNDVDKKTKFLDKQHFNMKVYKLQFPFCKLEIEHQTQLIQKRKTIVRSDLVITRSKAAFRKALSPRKGNIEMSAPMPLRQDASDGTNSQRNSWSSSTTMYNPSRAPSMSIKTASQNGGLHPTDSSFSVLLTDYISSGITEEFVESPLPGNQQQTSPLTTTNANLAAKLLMEANKKKHKLISKTPELANINEEQPGSSVSTTPMPAARSKKKLKSSKMPSLSNIDEKSVSSTCKAPIPSDALYSALDISSQDRSVSSASSVSSRSIRFEDDEFDMDLEVARRVSFRRPSKLLNDLRRKSQKLQPSSLLPLRNIPYASKRDRMQIGLAGLADIDTGGMQRSQSSSNDLDVAMKTKPQFRRASHKLQTLKQRTQKQPIKQFTPTLSPSPSASEYKSDDNDDDDNVSVHSEDDVPVITNYFAAQIWQKSCAQNAEKTSSAKLSDIYPNLVPYFKKWSICKHRVPSMSQLQYFFAEIAHDSSQANLHGSDQQEVTSIDINKFEQFYVWFKSMCNIVKDLQQIYDDEEQDATMQLFYSKKQANRLLLFQPIGTFIIRLAVKHDKVYISYKTDEDNVKHELYHRVDDEMYRFRKQSKPMFVFIRKHSALKLLLQ